MKPFLAYWLHFPVLFMGKVQSAPDVVAWVGGDITLSCLFLAQPGLDLQRITLTWQKERAGAEALVVHSYYYGGDQLARQAEAYRNRTRLDSEGLAQGNASLMLRGVRPQDEGVYRCHVTSELGQTSVHSELRVAAPFSEPQLAFGLSSAGVTLTVRTGGGYPMATVQWLDEAGRDVTGEGVTEQRADEQGLYEVTSWVTVPPATHSARLTFLLTPGMPGAPITRPLSLELRPGLLGPPPSCLGGRLAVVCAACLSVILLVVAFLYCPRWGPARSCSRRKAEKDERDTVCPVPACLSLQATLPATNCWPGLSPRGSGGAELEPPGASSNTTRAPSSPSNRAPEESDNPSAPALPSSQAPLPRALPIDQELADPPHPLEASPRMVFK